MATRPKAASSAMEVVAMAGLKDIKVTPKARRARTSKVARTAMPLTAATSACTVASMATGSGIVVPIKLMWLQVKFVRSKHLHHRPLLPL